MKYLGTALFHSLLVVAFIVGSAMYWSALAITALFIWTVASIYAISYRLYRAFVAFFQVLLANQKSANASKSGNW